MSQAEMEELLVFSQEIPLQQALFEKTPLWIAKIYLECFDSKGRQARRVPRHVLEALAGRLRLMMGGETKSLDEAFGGSVRRQRNRLKELDRQFHVSWMMRAAIDEIRQQPRDKRGKGTPFEIALERVAEELEMSDENVRRIYKAAGAR